MTRKYRHKNRKTYTKKQLLQSLVDYYNKYKVIPRYMIVLKYGGSKYGILPHKIHFSEQLGGVTRALKLAGFKDSQLDKRAFNGRYEHKPKPEPEYVRPRIVDEILGGKIL